MPEVGEEAKAVIRLHNQCRTYRALPCPGAVLEQPSVIMELFSEVDATIDEVRKQQLEEERTRAAKDRMLAAHG